MTAVLAWIDRRVGESVFRKVAGPDAERVHARVHHTPGPRWFSLGSPIRRVHGDQSMYVGGIRALLLQSLHPLAMAGVAGHSGYRGDPWGRLNRTAAFLAFTTFGTEDDAAETIARIRAVHARVRGRAPDGRAYRADDPHLLTWVHIAEVGSFLAAHDRFGRRPLIGDERDLYVAQTARVARALGAVDVPETAAELDATLARFRPELEATPAALDAARFMLDEPPLGPAARVPYRLLAAGAVATLPPWAAEALELRQHTRLGPAGAGLVVRTLRRGLASRRPRDVDPRATGPGGPATASSVSSPPGSAP